MVGCSCFPFSGWCCTCHTGAALSACPMDGVLLVIHSDSPCIRPLPPSARPPVRVGIVAAPVRRKTLLHASETLSCGHCCPLKAVWQWGGACTACGLVDRLWRVSVLCFEIEPLFTIDRLWTVWKWSVLTVHKIGFCICYMFGMTARHFQHFRFNAGQPLMIARPYVLPI